MDPKPGVQEEGVEAFASVEEAKAACESLTEDQHMRLMLAAKRYARGLGETLEGQSAGDLLQEAYLRTFHGSRQWRRSRVDFVGHLLGVMRSVASDWRRRRGTSPLVSTPTPSTTKGVEGDLDGVADSRASSESLLDAAQRVARLWAAFDGDEGVKCLLLGLQDAMKPAEIRELWEMSVQDYDAAWKRLKRGIPRIFADQERGS